MIAQVGAHILEGSMPKTNNSHSNSNRPNLGIKLNIIKKILNNVKEPLTSIIVREVDHSTSHLGGKTTKVKH